jgi:hypothetical protein
VAYFVVARNRPAETEENSLPSGLRVEKVTSKFAVDIMNNLYYSSFSDLFDGTL